MGRIDLPTIGLFKQFSRRLRLQYTRNSTDRYKFGTLTTLSRPDFLCCLRKSLIFRGEEKKDLEMAQTEQTQKLGQWNPMFYGNLPFIFAYATGGPTIQYVLSFYLFFFFLDTCGYTS